MLQFVPSHVDVRLCSFSERVEKGLLMAYAEVRKRSQETGNFTVHVRKSFRAVGRGTFQINLLHTLYRCSFLKSLLTKISSRILCISYI